MNYQSLSDLVQSRPLFGHGVEKWEEAYEYYIEKLTLFIVEMRKLKIGPSPMSIFHKLITFDGEEDVAPPKEFVGTFGLVILEFLLSKLLISFYFAGLEGDYRASASFTEIFGSRMEIQDKEIEITVLWPDKILRIYRIAIL